MSLKDWARETVYLLLYAWTGHGHGKRVILVYHSVGSTTPHSVPLPIFERHMEFLEERFKIMRLCDLQKVMQTDPPETNLACVTFDDGYRDNFEVALPVLNRMGLKATFFIATGFLEQTFRSSSGEYPMMTPSQVRELAALGHEIGAHTVHHPKLTKVPFQVAQAEICDSKRALEDLVQKEVVSFAYPNGDYNESVRRLVHQCSFRLAVTMRQGLVAPNSNGHPGIEWLALPRVWVSGKLSLQGFKSRITPATEAYRRIRGR